MTKTEYAEYLQSPEWQETRKQAFATHGEQCALCEMPRWLAEIAYDQDLHVHHLSYARKGNEAMEDLQILCRRCHDVETFGRSELRAPKKAKCQACGHTHWDPREAFCEICLAVFISEDFSARLRVIDLTFPPEFHLEFWHAVTSSVAYMCHKRGAPPIQDVLTHLAKTYTRGRWGSDRHPLDVETDFDAALSLVDFGTQEYEEDEAE